MYDRPNSLFAGKSAHQVILDLPQRAMEQLKALDENKILSTPTDDLVSSVYSKFRVEIPQLHDANAWIDEREIKREIRDRGYGYDVHEDRFGGERTIVTRVVDFHVPFLGDAGVFNLQPSQRSLPGPEAEIKSQELIITLVTDGKTAEQIRHEFGGRAQDIKTHLQRLKLDLQGLQTQIEGPARQYVEQRKAQLLQSKSLVASLGFPMKRRSEAPTTYRAPEVRRKIIPARPQTVAPFKPEPVLDEAEYQHILGVMDNMTKVMERSPHAFYDMGEEDIRQHFLVQLNGQYEGQATGETFNFQGKTDILIRSEGKNVFIAECKFWRGEKLFLETVDQLLSYLSWRDSKTAVMIFNRNKGLSSVIETMKSAMEKHPHKKSGPQIANETRLRYKLGNPSDHAREIITTIVVYDIPTAN